MCSSATPCTVKPVSSGHSKRRPKLGFQDGYSLNAGQKYCRMLQESIGFQDRYSLNAGQKYCRMLQESIGFQDRYSLNAGQKYCRMLQESILQYFRPSLSYHLSLRPLI